MDPTTLYTHLKIILLQWFQFSIFSFSNNKFNPNGPLVSFQWQNNGYTFTPKKKEKIIIHTCTLYKS